MKNAMMKEFVSAALLLTLSAFAAFAEASGPKLVPDYDRDGMIDEFDYKRAAAFDSFTVWLNDDDDAAGTNEGANAGDTNSGLHDVPGGNERTDCADTEVNGRCDLLDFFPVLVDVSEVSGWGGLTWKLCGAGVNVVFTKLNAKSAGSFHTQAVNAFGGEIQLYCAEVAALTKDGVKLPEHFL